MFKKFRLGSSDKPKSQNDIDLEDLCVSKFEFQTLEFKGPRSREVGVQALDSLWYFTVQISQRVLCSIAHHIDKMRRVDPR